MRYLFRTRHYYNVLNRCKPCFLINAFHNPSHDIIQQKFNSIHSLYEQNNFTQARYLCEDIIQSDGYRHTGIYRYLIAITYQQKDYNSSIKYCEELITNLLNNYNMSDNDKNDTLKLVYISVSKAYYELDRTNSIYISQAKRYSYQALHIIYNQLENKQFSTMQNDEQYNDNQELLCDIYSHLGNLYYKDVHQKHINIAKALEYYEKRVVYKPKDNDDKQMFEYKQTLDIIYVTYCNELYNYGKSIKYANELLAIETDENIIDKVKKAVKDMRNYLTEINQRKMRKLSDFDAFGLKSAVKYELGENGDVIERQKDGVTVIVDDNMILGQVYAKLGEKEKAVKYWKNVIDFEKEKRSDEELFCCYFRYMLHLFDDFQSFEDTKYDPEMVQLFQNILKYDTFFGMEWDKIQLLKYVGDYYSNVLNDKKGSIFYDKAMLKLDDLLNIDDISDEQRELYADIKQNIQSSKQDMEKDKL